eukprot:gb/GFBE01051770.1/.p1 GENE.gb/GFBE01051770.1/~~gb/GFBE01051770.1/.p1  ORF type:complete len:386 (+),score=44.23 gb/GFBE01051770.1/:1-1158(+)
MRWTGAPQTSLTSEVLLSWALSLHRMQDERAFFSVSDPPQIGDRVVCFRRGRDWYKRGQVTDVTETVSSGLGGLRAGEEGVQVTVALEDSDESFECWSSFLAPVNENMYSSLCTTHNFLSSKFCSMYLCDAGVGDVDQIPVDAARESLQSWLENLEDADGELLEVNTAIIQQILETFDTHRDNLASLYLYTTNISLGPRTSLIPGEDYSVYYRALNNVLNSDAQTNLQHAMLLIQRMMYLLLYQEDGSRLLHEGGRVWKGDTHRPVPLNMHKLRQAQQTRKLVRFRQFQSTTDDQALAEKYRRREDALGYLWTIDIPAGFWGARDIRDISWKAKESETLFPPYSAFRVESVDDDTCHLVAEDRRSELHARFDRQGPDYLIDLLGY